MAGLFGVRMVLSSPLGVAIASASAAEEEVPKSFLVVSDVRIQKALETPVSGEFRETKASLVFDALFRQLPANFVFASSRPAAPTFTGSFTNMPFRTAVFRVATATGYTLELTTRPDGSQVISVHD